MFYVSANQLKISFDNLTKNNQKMNSFLGLLALFQHGRPIADNYWRTDMVDFAKHLDEVFYLNEIKPTRNSEKYWYTLFQPDFTDVVVDIILKEKLVSLQDCAIVLMWHRPFENMNKLVETLALELQNKKLLDNCFTKSITGELSSSTRCTVDELQSVFGVTSDKYTLGFDGSELLSKPAGDISAAPFSQTLYAGTTFRKAFTVCEFDFLETYQLIPSKQKVNPLVSSDRWDVIPFVKKLKDANLLYNDYLSYRLISSLQTKPFTILTGLSGSGKTKLAEAFSLWICEDQAQICMVSVGADWTNREPLLGFPNALESNHYVKPDSGVLDELIAASKDPARPYFLILDEMNMSHVERYFADFLSAMESTDGTISLHSGTEEWNGVPPTITLPKNLFIIGTVNIDETTYMFSPKVLDRANVIEFRVSDSEMTSFFNAPMGLDMDSLRGAGASMGESFVAKALEVGLVDNDLGDALMPFFTQLQKAGAEFGYRTAAEMSRFVAICSELADTSMSKDDVIDAVIIQKLLPKLHGSRNKIEPILKVLGQLCLDDPKDEAFLLDDKNENKYAVKHALSYEKLMRMHDRVLADGFTSFAEA